MHELQLRVEEERLTMDFESAEKEAEDEFLGGFRSFIEQSVRMSATSSRPATNFQLPGPDFFDPPGHKSEDEG